MKIVLSFFESAANVMLIPNQFQEVLSTGYSERIEHFSMKQKMGVFLRVAPIWHYYFETPLSFHDETPSFGRKCRVGIIAK